MFDGSVRYKMLFKLVGNKAFGPFLVLTAVCLSTRLFLIQPLRMVGIIVI